MDNLMPEGDEVERMSSMNYSAKDRVKLNFSDGHG